MTHIHICKFGGSTLRSLQDIRMHAKRVASLGVPTVIVVSAMKGVTEQLLGCAESIVSERHADELAALLVTGEMQAAALFAMALKDLGQPAMSVNAWQCGLRAKGHPLSSVPDHLDVHVLREMIEQGVTPVVTGFQGVAGKRLVTLGRGGSDTTAVFLAASLGASVCTFYKDVPGLYAIDPKILPQTCILKQISYHEMLEASALGVNLLERSAVQFAMKHQITIHIQHAFDEGEGTMITDKAHHAQVKCIAQSDNQHIMTLRSDILGAGDQLIADLTDHCAHPRLLEFGPDSDGYRWVVACQAKDLPQSIFTKNTSVKSGLAVVSLVGWAIRSSPLFINEMLQQVLGEGIQIEACGFAETSVSLWVSASAAKRVVKMLSECIFEPA